MFRWLLAVFFPFVLAYADIGYVKSLQGAVFVVRDSFLQVLQKDDKLEKEDLISTKKSSRVILKFEDDTQISIGENSDFSILEYLYNENDLEESEAEFFYSRGIFKTISGKIGKLNQINYRLKTRTASMGIRGTEIYTKTDIAGDLIACLDGAITVTSLSTQQSVDLEKGFSTSVIPDQDPSEPKIFSCDELDGISKAECKEVKADDDNDGVLDILDQCPNTLASFLVDSKGCPSGFHLRFNFVKNDVEIDEQHPDILKVANYLKEKSSLKAEIIGYTDSRGSADKNLRLSSERAFNVYAALIKLGIERQRLSYDGYGAKDFVATNDTQEGREKNRRIYVRFIEE